MSVVHTDSQVQHVTILGASGSVGISTLDVIARHPQRYRVFALTAYRSVDELAVQCLRFEPRYAVMVDEVSAVQLAQRLRAEGSETQVLAGADALLEVSSHQAVDTVMAAIVGAAGLLPTLAAVRAGKKVLLANKEALVMAGQLMMAECAASGAVLLPVDSEHNAIFQCLPAAACVPGSAPSTQVRRVLLTASGGPFLDSPTAELSAVTVEQACRHPNWSMGPKISVDSATMMNKGLELIEACYLFGLPAQQVEVLIHPQSIVHSLVEYQDGSVLAQMGSPDMRVPIASCLAWPERVSSGADFLDLVRAQDLQFRTPDLQRFPCLALGMRAAAQGGEAAIYLNAANEVAVEAFLAGRIRFTDIPAIIEHTLTQSACRAVDTLAMILQHDAQARHLAAEQLASLGRS